MKIIHEPQLDTILMVEKAIRETQSYPTKKSLNHQERNTPLNHTTSRNDKRRVSEVAEKMKEKAYKKTSRY